MSVRPPTAPPAVTDDVDTLAEEQARVDDDLDRVSLETVDARPRRAPPRPTTPPSAASSEAQDGLPEGPPDAPPQEGR